LISDQVAWSRTAFISATRFSKDYFPFRFSFVIHASN
jgi:hypothetical protein